MNHWLLRLGLAIPFIMHGISVFSYSYGFDLEMAVHLLGLLAGVMVLVGGFNDFKIGDMCITLIGSAVLAILVAYALVMSHLGLIAALPLLGMSLYMAMEHK